MFIDDAQVIAYEKWSSIKNQDDPDDAHMAHEHSQ